VGAQAAAGQRRQSFVSEATWEAAVVNQGRLGLLQADPRTPTHEEGVVVSDDTGERQSGKPTAHGGRQYLGSMGKLENGLVVLSSLWAEEERYYPLQAAPYTPARRWLTGKADPAFGTKPRLALQLIEAALKAGGFFRASVADSGYGENPPFVGELFEGGLP
jgi:SRSO17 transposase